MFNRVSDLVGAKISQPIFARIRQLICLSVRGVKIYICAITFKARKFCDRLGFFQSQREILWTSWNVFKRRWKFN